MKRNAKSVSPLKGIVSRRVRVYARKGWINAMRIVGIDYGDARVGLAVSDEGELLATAAGTVQVTGVNDAVRKCAEQIASLHGELIVCGLPRNMDGSESFRAEKTRVFGEKLATATGLPVQFFDERLTTVEAYTYLNITDYNGRKRRSVIDTLSAQILLQAFLDSQRMSQKNTKNEN